MLANNNGTPQLNTELTAPIRFLEGQFVTRAEPIRSWFEAQWQHSPSPVYGSVDLRNAGFKLAPIDMNLFPAGFNNLNPDFFDIAVEAAEKTLQQISPGCQKILIIPENHTRNLFYWKNINTLKNILIEAGYEVKLASFSAEITAPLIINIDDATQLTLEPLQRNADSLFVSGFIPDVILLNNDLSEGIPDILKNVEQKIVPPPELGWSQRYKSDHFYYYAQVASEFAQVAEIDPWLIAPLFRYCGEVDFLAQEGLECLIRNATLLFAEIRKKYDEYGITQQPFLIVKADAGTYGMAVMTVRNVDELKNLNRKQRTKMASTKGGQPVHRVIIQEGVYTFETLGDKNAVAEPVVYLWGESVIGGFYRVHSAKGVDENLNVPGMQFEPIAFPKACHKPCEETESAYANRFYLYGIIAQLSMLAAAREIKR